MDRNGARCLNAATAVLMVFAPAMAQANGCAATVSELGKFSVGVPFPLAWRETTMSDGKPLVVRIADRDGGLFLEFTKTGEGLWARGPAVICAMGDKLQARMSPGFRLGPAAHWILRHSLGRNAYFDLSPQPDGRLRIATPGWSGVFVAAAN